MADKKERRLVIIESPAKAKSLKNYLGRGWDVVASNGHVRDLPKNRIGVNLDTLEPAYTILPDKRASVARLRKTAGGYKSIYLAADPDREGEAICWHISRLLQAPERKFYRIRFNAITRSAVQIAAKSASDIDMDLVDAQQARRVMDRLVGYRVSPYLWRTVGKGLSAGRVQTVALMLISEREKAIKSFTPVEFWPVTARFRSKSEEYTGRLFRQNGKRADGEKYSPKNRKDADSVLQLAKKASWEITDIEEKLRRRKPSPPFITSSLQVTASSRLSFSPSATMRLAQDLYEGFEIDGETTGLITYMRTDSVRIEPSALDGCREYIKDKWGAEALSEKPRRYRSSGGAQDAHEAIRPTDPKRTPDSLKGLLDSRHLKLYTLIWNRFIATQMKEAVIAETTVTTTGGSLVFRTVGQKVASRGFAAVDPGQISVTSPIPDVSRGPVELLDINTEQKFTKPPARFTEAGLVSEMKKLGIGRPSTYVSIIATLKKRGYTEVSEKKLIPSEVGMVTSDLLTRLFPHIFQIDFTARMEELLDMIASGRKEYKDAVAELYRPLAASLESAMQKLPEVKASLARETTEKCPECGRNLVEKISKYGKFLACPGFPGCRYTKPVEDDSSGKAAAPCPVCGEKLSVRRGRYGRYAVCSACDYKGPLPAGVSCPEEGCSGVLVERTSRKGRVFYSCSRYPDCRYSMWNRPIDRRCPRCGFPLLEQRKKGVYCPNCRKKTD